MIIAVRPTSSHTAVGLFVQCLAQQRRCGTTSTVSRLFNCTSQRGQSNASVARISSKAIRPAQWQSLRNDTRCAASNRTTRKLVTDAGPSPKFANALAVPTESSTNTVSHRAAAERAIARKQCKLRVVAGKRQRLERVIKYTFKDDDYFQASVHHELKFGDDVLKRVQSQLAIIGNSLIKMIWYGEQFPAPDPVKLNRRWNLIASNKALARAAHDLDLVFLLKMEGKEYGSRRARKTGEHKLGTLVEAIIGAVYLDSGHNYTATKDVVERLTLLNPPTANATGIESRLPPRVSDFKPPDPSSPPGEGTRRTRKRQAPFRKASERGRIALLQDRVVATDDSPPSTQVANVYAQFHV